MQREKRRSSTKNRGMLEKWEERVSRTLLTAVDESAVVCLERLIAVGTAIEGDDSNSLDLPFESW